MKKRSSQALMSIGVTFSFLVAFGCDGGPSVDSSSTEATVKGVVKVAGNPATDGEILFDASNIKRPNSPLRSAPIGKDGSYTIKTLTGENIIRLGGAITKKNGSLQATKRAMIVSSGENTFNFEVAEESKPPR